MNTHTFSLRSGTTPLVLSLPHVGTEIPDAMKPLYVDRALAVEDTDWHLEKLYDFAVPLGASIITPKFSRYVIDLNRPPDNTPMYPGASNTELCPSTFFNGEPLYRVGLQPDELDVDQRRETYWRPYHDALDAELSRIREKFGYALLWDGHSIRSEIPWLFDGKLPDLNLGTASGASSDASLRTRLADLLVRDARNTHAVDGRFKGGYITRHYGRPHDGFHAVQLEMCQSLYMQEVSPFDFDEAKSAQIQPMLKRLLQVMLDWSPSSGTC